MQTRSITQTIPSACLRTLERSRRQSLTLRRLTALHHLRSFSAHLLSRSLSTTSSTRTITMFSPSTGLLWCSILTLGKGLLQGELKWSLLAPTSVTLRILPASSTRQWCLEHTYQLQRSSVLPRLIFYLALYLSLSRWSLKCTLLLFSTFTTRNQLSNRLSHSAGLSKALLSLLLKAETS